MSSYSTSTSIQKDQRQFAEGQSALVGPGSVMAYPTSVSVFGSPGSEVGDITFVTHAPAPTPEPGQAPSDMMGLSDQLASIMSNISGPAVPAVPAGPAMPTGQPAAKPNYILWAALAAGAFLIWRM